MAKAIGTSWTTLKTYDWIPGTGFRASFYLEARYSSSEKNNIEGNYSNIYTRLRSVVHAGQGSGSNYKFTCSYAPEVKGSSIWYLGTEVITESGVTKITHEDDGTKTITLTASGSISPIGLNFSISEDVVLDTIPRATTLLDQSGTIGHNITINWTPASDKFTHKLTYSFGSIKDEVLGTSLKKSFTWSIPAKLYKEFTGQSAKGTLKLTTYNGTTQIGSTQEVSLTIYANQSFSEPVIDGASLKDINSTTVALTGDNETFILGQSKLFLTLTFKTRNFATLKSLSINGTTIANNKVTAGTQSTDGTTVYGLEYEYGTLNTKQLLFKVTDTRNFAVELKTVISDSIVINYIPLTAVTTFKRITPTGGKVGLVFNGNYFNGSFGASSNTLEISYKYKKSTDSTYTTINLVNNTDYKISGNTYYSGTGSSKQTITLAPTFDYKTQYDVQVTIKDKLTTLPIINAIISKGIPIMWWNGEKVQVNGDLYLADENSENVTPLNVSGKVSKNLYNKNTVYIEGAFNQNASNEIPVLPNTTYTFSIGGYTWGEVQEFNNSGTQTNHFGGNENDKIITFTTSPNAKYIRVVFYTGISNVSLSEIDFTQIQLELGSTATEYEEYYTTLSIRNSNGVFQEVLNFDDINKTNYSSGEQIIGTWIDGKTVYRRVIDIGSIPSNTSRTYDIGLNLTNCFPIKWTMLGRFSWGMVKQYTEGRDLISSFRNDGFLLESFADFSSAIGILIVEYTKN